MCKGIFGSTLRLCDLWIHLRFSWFFSWISLVALLLGNLRKDILYPFEAYVDKGNILRQRLERFFPRNCFLICEFISQSYTIFFLEQYGSTVFGESEKGYFRSHWSLWWDRKYPHIKARKKVSEKVLCDVWIHLTELHLSFMEQLANTVFVESAKGYLGAHDGP